MAAGKYLPQQTEPQKNRTTHPTSYLYRPSPAPRMPAFLPLTLVVFYKNSCLMIPEIHNLAKNQNVYLQRNSLNKQKIVRIVKKILTVFRYGFFSTHDIL
jgi:hypothetical protein